MLTQTYFFIKNKKFLSKFRFQTFKSFSETTVISNITEFEQY